MHTSSAVTLMVAVFLASCVESVEALTIVVASGVSRGWRSALEGAAAAVGVLVLLVGSLGPAIVYLVPISALRAVVGTLLLVFGLQWLRKAVLRSAGLKAKHDEDAIFQAQVEALASTGRHRQKRDSTGFVVSFKGVFLEGLEVAVIVIGLGGTDHRLALASAAAAVAIVVVAGTGFLVARQLAGVPENAMKMAVGLMLVSFGTFWAGEGLGVHWPGSDLAVPVLVGAYGAVAWSLVRALHLAYAPSSSTGPARAA
ncbi:MAG: COG4280 domain-containing protein [Acidimicrobiales bacterium]